MLVETDIKYDSRVLKEASTLSKNGYNVTIIALFNKGLRKNECLNGFRIERVIVRSRLLKSKIFLPLKLLELWLRMFCKAIAIDAHFYHCHDITPMLVAWIVSRMKNAKLIYDSHELEYDRNSSKPLRLLSRYYERLFINKVDHIIVSDGEFRARLMIKKNNCKIPIDYVMNCPPKTKIEESNKNLLRGELGIAEGDILVVYIGALIPGRGINNIIRAIAHNDNISLVLVGNYSELKLSALQKRYNLVNRIQSTGPYHYEELINVISGADIGLVLIENTCLSYYYSTPTKLFEFIAAGIPVVTSNFPAMERIVLDNSYGRIGECVDPLDYAQIENAIIEIANSIEKYDNMKSHEMKLHYDQYNWEYQETKLLKVYKDLSLL